MQPERVNTAAMSQSPLKEKGFILLGGKMQELFWVVASFENELEKYGLELNYEENR